MLKTDVLAATAAITGMDTIKDATSVLVKYDSAVAKLALSMSELSQADRARVLENLTKIKQEKLIHAAYTAELLDIQGLTAEERIKAKVALDSAFSTALETEKIEALSAAEIENILTSNGVRSEKAKEIAARYANAEAAQHEADVIEASLYGIKKSFSNAFTFMKTNPFAVLAGIIGAAFYGAYRYNQYLKDSLDESVEKYQDLTSEVESLESQLTEVRDRIKEIEALDSPTLIDEQELAKLKEQNDELYREIQYKKILQEQADKDDEDNAFRWLNGNKYLVSTTTTNPYSGETQVKTQEVSWDTYVKQQMQNYKDLEQQIKDTKDARDQLDKSDTDGIEAATSKIESLEQQQGKIITDIGNTYQELKENVYDVLGGDAYTEAGQEFLNLWQFVWDAFDEMVNGIDGGDVVDKFFKTFNARLAVYLNSGNWGGNVDLTTRPRVSRESMLDAGWNDFDGTYATTYSSTYGNEDGTKAILVTPILPNGDVLTPRQLDEYVEGLLDGKTDTYGITIGVFEGEDAIQTADTIGERVSVAQSKWDEYVDAMLEGGYISDTTAATLKLLANTVLETGDAFSSAEDSTDGFSEKLSVLAERYDLLAKAQKELKESKTITSDTLSSIAKINGMQDSVNQFILGMKTSKELLADLKKLYQEDALTFYRSNLDKYESSVGFYKSILSNQSQLVKNLENAYNVDLKNFKTIEEAKAEFQKAIVQKLALQYSQYANASLQGMQAQYDHLIDAGGDPKELKALGDALKAIEQYNYALDKIAKGNFTESWVPKFSSSFAEEAKNAAKSAEDALKKLKEKIDDWFSDMQFKVDLRFNAGDIEGAEKLYLQMIEQANKYLNDAYASGLTINDDLVQDLIEKVNTYKKAIADLRTDEYDKLIEYNDQFDVWNQVSYTKLDVLRKKLEAINEQYIKGYISYQDWYQSFIDTAGSIYDIQRDALDELLDTVEDALKKQNDAQVESLEKQRDALTDLIELKKKLLEDTRDEADYEKEVAKRVREIAKLQERISQLALDTSREATAERIALEEELAEKQAELTDYQSTYATDAAIDALDKQQEKYESVYDDQIDAIKAQVEDEVALRQQAIQLIDRDYRKMMQNVQGYFEKLGVTIDQELLQKLNQGLDLVSQYGSYSSADSGISQNAGSGMLGTQTVSALVQQMKQNASAWHGADTSEQKRLAEENERIAKMLRDVYGLDVWKDSAKGVWYIRLDGRTEELFRMYHTGGVAGDQRTPQSDEIFALLKKGEVILNKGQQNTLLSIFENAGKWMQEQMAVSFGAVAKRMGSFTSPSAPVGFGSFSPSIEVNIHHNGSMTEADAKRYGQVAADTALDKLWETMQKRGIT